MRFCFIILGFSLLVLQTGLAQPQKVNAHPGLKTFAQPDGSVLMFKLIGNANINYRETTDGYTIIKAKDGFYKYAKSTWGGNLKASKVIAHNEDKRAEKEQNYLRKKEKNLRYTGCTLKKKLKKAKSGPQ